MPSGAAEDVSVGGGVYPQAVYWTYLEVGTPPVRSAVIFDTGSPFLNVEASRCANCLHEAPNIPYDPDASSTSSPYSSPPSAWNRANGMAPAAGPGEPDSWNASYYTCDAKHPMDACHMGGRLFTDKVSLAGFGPVDVVFGTIDEESANINPLQEVTGLMGIMPPAPMFAERHVLAQLVASGACRNIFGLCLHDGASSHGTLTVGGADSRLATGLIKYVPDLRPNISAPSSDGGAIHAGVHGFGVRVASMMLGVVGIEWSGTAMLDSGTNILILPSDVYTAARRTMCADASLEHCESLWHGNCSAMSDAQIDSYPSWRFGLDGVTLEMSSRDYLLLNSPLAEAEDQRCLGISDGGPLFLFGDTTLRNYYVVHDLEHQRIGWGAVNRATCGSLHLESPPPVIAVFT